MYIYYHVTTDDFHKRVHIPRESSRSSECGMPGWSSLMSRRIPVDGQPYGPSTVSGLSREAEPPPPSCYNLFNANEVSENRILSIDTLYKYSKGRGKESRVHI